MGIAQAIQEGVEHAIQTYATNTSASLSAALTPVALTGVTIYLVVIGFSIARGDIQDSMSAIVQNVLKISLICAIALSGGIYQSMVIEGINGIEGIFTNSIGGQPTIGALIDSSIVPMETITGELYRLANEPMIPDVSLVVAAALCTIGQTLVTVCSLVPLLVAKVTMAVLLAIGPAFILLALWPTTTRFAEAWLSATLSAAITVAVIAAVVGFLPRFIQYYAGRVLNNLSTTNVLQDVLSLVLVIIVLGWVAWKASDLGGSIGGGAILGNPAQAIAQTIMKIVTGGGDGAKASRASKNSISRAGNAGSATSSNGNFGNVGTQASSSLAHQNVITNLHRKG